MAYLLFHPIFLMPPILLMGSTLPCRLQEMGGRRAQYAIPLIDFVAFTYTTPWDNYLVARKVWWYGSDRVLATVGYVPLEEYLFFFLQPILTGLFFFHYLGRWRRDPRAGSSSASWIGFFVFAGITLFGILLLIADGREALYMGLVLTWASPLLAGMWLYDGETLAAHRTTLIYTVAFPTFYLWIADAIAIRAGIWTISDEFTLGLRLFNLPLEEATFFLLTNLLVVKGILLLLYGSHDAVSSDSS